MTEITRESSLESKEIEYNRIDYDNNEYGNDIVVISNQVIDRMSNNDGMNDEKMNLKRKWKWKQKWQKYKYSRKMKKKIAAMIENATKEYPLVRKM